MIFRLSLLLKPCPAIISAAIMVIFLFVAHPAKCEVINEDWKMIAGDGGSGSQFGVSIAINDGLICIGAYKDDNNLTEAGAAYLFSATTGEKLFRLDENNAQGGDHFGISVDIGNGMAAVGSHGAYNNPSAVFLFSLATGNQIRMIQPSDSDYAGFFGASLAMENNLLVVGDPDDDDNDSNSGSAYIFDNTTGSQLLKLLPSDGASFQYFGTSVDMDSGLVVVGALQDDDNGVSSGSAYIFDATTGEQLFKLVADDGEPFDHFGHSVAIDDGMVAVGAPWESVEVGAVYVFDASTGEQVFKIVANTGAENDEFGDSVDIDNGILAIGAPGRSDNGLSSGIAYLYDLSTGEQIHQVFATDTDLLDHFGTSIALHGGMLVSGADFDRTNNVFVGAAYAFSFSHGGVSSAPVSASGINLYPNYPNPFNPGTTIGYSLEQDGLVELAVYSLKGELVRVLVNRWQTSGVMHSAFWDGKDSFGRTQASGVYYSLLRSKDHVHKQKMVLLK
ncbi:MAG: hypothetical protein GY780_10265 [bacterium]|nr:hypothetical protein [bacterium]